VAPWGAQILDSAAVETVPSSHAGGDARIAAGIAPLAGAAAGLALASRTVRRS